MNYNSSVSNSLSDTSPDLLLKLDILFYHIVQDLKKFLP